MYVFSSSIDRCIYIYIYIYIICHTLVRCYAGVRVNILCCIYARNKPNTNHIYEVGNKNTSPNAIAGGQARVDAWRPYLMTSFLRSVGVHVTPEQRRTWIQKRRGVRYSSSYRYSNQPVISLFRLPNSDDVDTEMGTSEFQIPPQKPTKPTHPDGWNTVCRRYSTSSHCK